MCHGGDGLHECKLHLCMLLHTCITIRCCLTTGCSQSTQFISPAEDLLWQSNTATRSKVKPLHRRYRKHISNTYRCQDVSFSKTIQQSGSGGNVAHQTVVPLLSFAGGGALAQGGS